MLGTAATLGVDPLLVGSAPVCSDLTLCAFQSALHATAHPRSRRPSTSLSASPRPRPDAFLPDHARSLNNLSVHLSNLGRREEALAASQEAVDIYRRLAETRPDAFLPDLARSLDTLGNTLASAGRHQEAAAARLEGLTLIATLVERRPQAFGHLARALYGGYLESCERTGAEPNSALVERIARLVAANATPQQ